LESARIKELDDMVMELVKVFGLERGNAEKEVVNYYLTGCMSK